MDREITAVWRRLAGGPAVLPSHDELRAVVLHAGGDDLVQLVVQGTEKRHPDAVLAAIALPRLGLLPADMEPLSRFMNDAIGSSPDDAGLALALASFAPITVRALQAAVAPGADPALAAPVVLKYAEQVGRLDSAAADVASGLDLDQDLGAVLQLLGVPHFTVREGRPSPEVSAQHGASAAGAALPPLRIHAHGALRHQVSAWVRALLADTPGPAAALLRAAAARNLAVGFVASAAWLALYRPSDDPVRDVLNRSGSYDRIRFSEARRGLRPAHAPALLASLAHDEDCAILAAGLGSEPAVAEALVRAYLKEGDEPTGRCAAAVVSAVPDLLDQSLKDPSSLVSALYLAAFVPRVAPLISGLAVPVAHTARHHWALAAHFPNDPRLDAASALAPATASLRYSAARSD